MAASMTLVLSSGVAASRASKVHYVTLPAACFTKDHSYRRCETLSSVKTTTHNFQSSWYFQDIAVIPMYHPLIPLLDA